jgi:hypothetical protein
MEGHSQEPLDAADEAQPVVPISCHPLHQDGARRR